MALKLVIDKLDDVAEPLRTLYVEKEGKFYLDAEVEDTTSMKEALRNANKEAAERRKALDTWKKLGKTPEEIEELVAAAALAAEEKLKGAGEWDKLKAQMNEKHEAALKAKDAVIDAGKAEVTAMKKSLERHLIDAQATAAIATAKGEPDLLLPIVQRFIKVNEENGNYTTLVVDAKGDPRVDSKGNPMTVDAFVTELKATEKYGRAFEGSGASGSGTRPANGAGGAGTITKRSDLKDNAARAAFVDAHGIEAYTALPL